MPIEKNFQEFFWLFKNIEKTLNRKITKIPKLLYRGTRDGFEAANFHEKCDNKKPILILISNKFKKKFGGFVNESFSSPKKDGEFKYCDRAFLFSMDNRFISPIKDSNNSILCNKDDGPIFGYGGNLIISSKCNSNTNSSTYWFGCSYSLPNGIFPYTPESRAFLSGNNTNNSGSFQVED